ncbi:protein of unknown function (plasmid) [Caballeronia sp. S22]
MPSSAQSWGYVASRNISKVSGSCLSVMNFAKKLALAQFTRNAGRHCRSALATTNSDGGMGVEVSVANFHEEWKFAHVRGRDGRGGTDR